MVGQRYIKWFFCLLFGGILVSFSSCSNYSTLLSVSETPEGSFDDSVFSSSVQEIAGESESSIAIDGDVSEFLIALYSYSSQTSSDSFQLGDGRVLTSSEAKNFAGEEDAEDSFQQMLRDVELTLTHQDDARVTTTPRALKAARSVGDEEAFNVLNSTSSTDDYETVTATLRYAGDGFNFYVDNRNADSVDDEDLAEIAEGFNVEAMHEIFGEESDVNDDGRFAVLFTQAVNELGASSGGIVTGYFFAVDLYDSSFYAVSNEREVFYTVVPDPEGEVGTAISHSFAMSNLYPTVLPHEFQHMINFNERVFEHEFSTESAWLNEGLSHLAEDIMYINEGGFLVQTSIENYSRVSSYLGNIQNTCITCGTSLSQRGGAYLFLRYLYEQAELGNLPGIEDGATLILSLIQNEETGITKVANILSGDDLLGIDITEILGQWALAIYFSNTDVTGDDHYQFTGINLRAEVNDNRGTELNGPAIQNIDEVPFVDTMQGVSLTYLNVDAEVLTDDSLTISFGDSAEFGGYAIW